VERVDMKSGQNTRVATLFGSTIPSTLLDVVQGVCSPSTIVVLPLQAMQVL